ncbi:MAG: two component transcriptional regulator, LuxR family [Acidimicrobiales bacterium]|nr:two component transcriptional regulator, LuxR family [Acidimicrobiales bacterium]
MTSSAHAAPTRVVICDDHVVFRRGLALVLEPEDDITVVGEAADTAAAVQAALDHLPDVVLMDLRMPGGGGLEATRRIRALHPEARVIVLTVSDDDADLFEAIKAGAVGYLLKEVSIEEVADAVRTVAAGNSLLSPTMTTKLLDGFSDLARQAEARPASVVGPGGNLTDRELEALRGIARGLSNREIATELGIAENTVKNHVRGVLEKLDVKSRTEAALYAVREGLADPS